MILPAEVQTLQSFNSNGHITLSAYLCMETPHEREMAYDAFVGGVQACLDRCRPQPECRKAIQEDVEIVGLYLKTNGHRHRAGLAIFSCAAEFFWRAYSLEFPVATQVAVGPRFDLEPLRQLTTA